MPIQVPVTQTGLEASIQAAAQKAGKNLKINLGTNARSIEALSQPLGRITGKADEFTKSMEAANARVLAFGASVGVLSAITRGFRELVKTTIEVEKSLANINTILNVSAANLDKFKKQIFDVARNTEQTFETVAQAALELSRQGLKAEEVTRRLNDAMILARLSGLGAGEAVSGLTAAINSFNSEGLTSAEVLNKIAAAAVKAAVSEKDLIEGIKRSGAVAIEAGVTFDELVGVISALQQQTARGGSVIGNSLKTIFTRLQSLEKLKVMQELGTEITDASGAVLPATKLIENLGKAIQGLPDTRKLQIAENLVGKFQIAPFLAILRDYNSETQVAINLTEVAARATNEAYTRNVTLNQTLSAAINEATVNLKELANTLGEIGVTESLKNILGFFNSLVSNIKDLLEGEGLGSDFARGIVKGIGNVLSGPGLAIFGAIIAKLTIDLARFGASALKTFFGLNRTAKEIANTQGAIASSLLKNSDIQKQILSIENSTLSVEQKRAAQTKFFTTALNAQLATMKQMQAIAASIAPAVVAAGRAGSAGRPRGRAAGGFIPNFDAVRGYGSEQQDIRRGVGGAPSSARPVTIPNFNFGAGQRGTMVANSSEFIVPNYAGGSGSAIFNQDMVRTMGMPAGARSLAAGGYIPNFALGPAAVLNARGIRDLSQFRNLAGTGKTRIIDGVKVTEAQAKNVFARQAGAKSTVLDFPASTLGVAALFAGKASDNTEMRTSTLVGEPAAVAKRDFPGVEAFRFTGVQIRSLNDATSGIRKQKQEGKFRRKLEELFLEPLARLGSSLVGPPPQGAGFAADELSKINSQTRSRKRDPDIFSTSVQGGLFESAIRLFTKGVSGIPEFKSHNTEQAPFDFEESGAANQHFKKAFGFTQGLKKADAKRSASPDSVRTLIPKALKDAQTRGEMKKFFKRSRAKTTRTTGGRRAAGGYIPNFDATRGYGPLEDAVMREKAAGLPLNQIRVNQDARLRNADNPMGLAVTNTRDEPTGSIAAAAGYIPNFILPTQGPGSMSTVKGLGSTKVGTGGLDKADKAASKLADKMLGVMFAASMLSGAFSDTESAFGKTMEQFGKSVMNTSIALMALSMLPEKTKSGFGAFGKNMAQLGATAIVASQAFKLIHTAVLTSEDSILNNAKAQDLVAKAAERAAINLGMLGAGDKADVQARTESGVRAALISNIERDDDFGSQTAEFVEGVVGRIFNAARGDFGQKRTSLGGLNVFEGMDDQKMETLLGAADVAVAAGASTQEVMDIIDRIGAGVKSGETFTEKNFLQMVKEISGLTNRLTPEAFEKAFEKIDPEGGRMEALRSLQARQEGAEGAGMTTEAAQLENQLARERLKLEKDLRAELKINDIAAENAVNKELKGLKDLQKEQKELAKEEAKRLAITKALGQVERAGTALKTRLNVVSSVERELELAQALGKASADEIGRLKTRVELRKINEKSLLATAEAMQQVANLTEEVTGNEEDAKKAAETIRNLTFDQVDTEKERAKVITDIAEQLGVAEEKIANQVEEILKGVNANEKFLNSERDKVKAAEQFNRVKREALDLQKAELMTAQLLLSKEENAAKTAFAKRQADLQIAGARRQIGANTRSVVQERAVGVLSARDAVSAARLNLDQQRDANFRSGLRDLGNLGDRNEAVRRSVENIFEQRAAEGTPEQRRQFSELFSSTTGDTATMFVALAQDSQDLQKAMQELVVDMRTNEDVTKSEIKEVENLIEKYKGLSEVTEEQGRGALKAAEALLKVAQGAGEIPSLSTLAINRADEIERGIPGRQLEANLTADPFARAKAQIGIDSAGRLADAIRKEDFAMARSIQQADEFKNILVDASSQFSNNLGTAMFQAIRDGASFGDALKGAGLTFLDYISEAMMQMAARGVVDSIFSGGGGGGLFGGGGIIGRIFGKSAGGLITGGSGRKDDVPAMLMGGEFVMSRAAVADYGVGFMKQLNERRVQGFANGGSVGDLFSPSYSGRALRGKNQLMGFARQGVTSGSGDFIRGGSGGGGGFGVVSLQPGSIRGTQFQRRRDPVERARTEARGNALNLYFRQLESEEQRQAAWEAEQQRLLEQRIRQAELERRRREAEKQRREAEKRRRRSGLGGLIGGALLGPIGWIGGAALGGSLATGGYAQGGLFGLLGLGGLPSFQKMRADMEERGREAGYSPSNPAPRTRGGLLGGVIRQAAGVDTVPTMLSGGEFVMNAAATRRIGRSNLADLNSGVGGASGGSSSALLAAIGGLIGAQSRGDSGNNISITINQDGIQSTNMGGNTSRSAQSLASRIRDAVTEIIAEEKRLGGVLRRA